MTGLGQVAIFLLGIRYFSAIKADRKRAQRANFFPPPKLLHPMRMARENNIVSAFGAAKTLKTSQTIITEADEISGSLAKTMQLPTSSKPIKGSPRASYLGKILIIGRADKASDKLRFVLGSDRFSFGLWPPPSI